MTSQTCFSMLMKKSNFEGSSEFGKIWDVIQNSLGLSFYYSFHLNSNIGVCFLKMELRGSKPECDGGHGDWYLFWFVTQYYAFEKVMKLCYFSQMSCSSHWNSLLTVIYRVTSWWWLSRVLLLYMSHFTFLNPPFSSLFAAPSLSIHTRM